MIMFSRNTRREFINILPQNISSKLIFLILRKLQKFDIIIIITKYCTYFSAYFDI